MAETPTAEVLATAPGRPPTHRAVPADTLRAVGEALITQAKAQELPRLTPTLIEGVARDLGVPRAHAYAAAALVWRPFANQQPIQFVVCVGQCQWWGAMDVVSHLLDRRDERLAAGKPAFDVQTRSCLNGCGRGPTVVIATPLGMSGLAGATPATVDDVLEALDDEAA